MSALASHKKYWYWVVLVALSALIAAAAFVAPGKISQIELKREALVAADRLKAQMLKEPDALFYALANPSATPQFADILNKSGYGSRVLRYELYEPDGELAFTAGLAGLQLDEDLATLLASPADAAPKVTLYQASGDSRPTNFVAITLPLALDGEPRGTLVVYLDQSDQAAVLASYFGLIAAITLMLLGAGMAVPAAFAWMRGRERFQAEEQVRYLEEHDALTGLANRKAFGDSLADAITRMTATAPISPCCAWTSTSSRRSTTPPITRAATRCCATLAPVSRRRCARAT